MKAAKRRGKATGTNLVPLTGGTSGYQVLSVSETEARKVHDRIIELKQQQEETYFELARLLYRVFHEKLYVKISPTYQKFDQYVEGELGYKIRTAQYFIKIWDKFGVELGENSAVQSRVKALGWAKAKELTEVIDKDNAEEWLDLAEKSDVKELVRNRRAALRQAGRSTRAKMPKEDDEPTTIKGMKPMVKTMALDGPTPMEMPKALTPLGGGGNGCGGVDLPTPEALEEEKRVEKIFKTLVFKVPEEWVEIIDEAVQCAVRHAQGRLKPEDRGLLLAHICLHFCGYHSKHSSILTGQWLKQFEEMTGLSVVAIDEVSRQFVYGEQTAERLANKTEEEAS